MKLDSKENLELNKLGKYMPKFTFGFDTLSTDIYSLQVHTKSKIFKYRLQFTYGMDC